jgi:hypothetical protein
MTFILVAISITAFSIRIKNDNQYTGTQHNITQSKCRSGAWTIKDYICVI